MISTHGGISASTNGRIQPFRTRTNVPRGRGMLRRKQKSMRSRREEQTPPKRAIDRTNVGSSLQRPLSVSTVASFASSNKSGNDASTRRSSATTEYSFCPNPMVTQINEALPAGQTQETNTSDHASTACQTPVNEQRKEGQLERAKETTERNDIATWEMNNQKKRYQGDLAGISGEIEGTNWHYSEETNTEDLRTTKEMETVQAGDVKWRKFLLVLETSLADEEERQRRDGGFEGGENSHGGVDEPQIDIFDTKVEIASPKSEMGNVGNAQLAPPRPVAEPEIPQNKPPSPRSHINQQQQQQKQRGHATYNPFQGGLLEAFLDQDDVSEGQGNSSLTKQLRSTRVEVFRLREEYRRMRQEIERKEKVKIATDEAFMRHVRENMLVPVDGSRDVLSPLFSKLDQLFTKMQAARDEYGPLDDKFNALFDALDDKEFDMARIEGRVYRQKADDEAPPVSNKGTSSSSDSLREMSWEEKYHPLHAKYLSRLGDLELAEEDYDNMQHDLDDLLYKQDTNARSNIPFDPDLEAFMEGLPAQRTALETKIASIEADVEDLRRQCLEEGIYLQPRTISSVGSETNTQEVSEVSLPDTNSLNMPCDVSISQKEGLSHDIHSMFHLLSPNPIYGRDELFRDLITEFDEDNKSDRINRWLLHGLQTSPLALDLLVQVFLGVVNILDLSKWQTNIFQWKCSVLFEWERDAANIPAEAFNWAVTRSSFSHVSKDFVSSSTKKPFALGGTQFKDLKVIHPRSLRRTWKSAPSGLGSGFRERVDFTRKYVV